MLTFTDSDEAIMAWYEACVAKGTTNEEFLAHECPQIHHSLFGPMTYYVTGV